MVADERTYAALDLCRRGDTGGAVPPEKLLPNQRWVCPGALVDLTRWEGPQWRDRATCHDRRNCVATVRLCTVNAHYRRSWEPMAGRIGNSLPSGDTRSV